MAQGDLPLAKYKVFLGKDKNIEIAVWSTNVQLQRRENIEGKGWQTTQKINLAPNVLESLFARIPIWLRLMEKAKEAEGS